MSKLYRIIIAISILIVAIAVRIANVELRPLQFDEAVNYSFINKLLSGNDVSYDSTNFHGTLLFYFNAFLIKYFNLYNDCSTIVNNSPTDLCLNIPEKAFRIGSVLFGSLLVLIPFLISSISFNVRIVLSLLLCFTPSLIFLSQVNIHEIYFAFFSTSFLICLYEYLLKNNPKHFVFLILSFGLMIATKETWIITFIIGLALSFLFFKDKLNEVVISWLKILPASFLIASPFYLKLSSPIQSLGQFVKGIFSWSNTGIKGNTQIKPLEYYLKIIFEAEPTFYVLILIAFISILLGNFYKNESATKEMQSNNSFGLEQTIELFLFLSTVLLLLIYSLISYKTPWLIISIILPGIIGIGGYLFKTNKFSTKIIVLLLMLIINYKTYLLNDPKHPHALQPVPSYEGVRELANFVQNSCAKISDCKILVIAKEFWPIPFYLQNYSRTASYVTSRMAVDDSYLKKFDILIVEMDPFKRNVSNSQSFLIHARLKVEVTIKDYFK